MGATDDHPIFPMVVFDEGEIDLTGAVFSKKLDYGIPDGVRQIFSSNVLFTQKIKG